MRGLSLPPAAVAGALATGALALGSIGPARAPAAAASPSAAFARRVLAEAVLPPGTSVAHRALSGLLARPADSPGVVPLVDLRRFYLLAGTPKAVTSYLAAHLPAGGRVIGTGTEGAPGESAATLTLSLPTAGPHEYLAQLAYAVAPAGAGRSELRVDAQTVWLPLPPAAERVPVGALQVTGFARSSLAGGASGAVTVRVLGSRAAHLRALLDQLPPAPAPRCMEDAPLYRITVGPSGSSGAYLAEGEGCAQTVLVSVGARQLPPRHDASCALLRAAAALLPPAAAATRQAAAGCQGQAAGSR